MPADAATTGIAELLSLAAFLLLSFLLTRAWIRFMRVSPSGQPTLCGRNDYVFACSVATVLSVLLIGEYHAFFRQAAVHGPFLMALILLSVLLGWRLLFGPWPSHVKATVLATFIVWVALYVLWQTSAEERLVRLLTILIALAPALIWCFLFLDFHAQRRSLALLMFLGGMIATAPVLFYDTLARHGIELQFFIVRIVPENFTRVAQNFVSGTALGTTPLQSTLAATLLSFLIVGFIEEASKYWALMHSGRSFFSSINDVMQLAIIVSIGFAFAENVLNPTYFQSFIREYLLVPEHPEWMGFLSSVLGRSILTTMVHIFSGGVLGYFMGRALFADPCIAEEHGRGRQHWISHGLQALLRIPERTLFRGQMILTGFLIAVALHGVFNFLVTLQDILPGSPRPLGDLLGSPESSLLSSISLLLLPSLFYVVGGFWILTSLLLREESSRERGRVVQTEAIIRVATT